MKGFAHCTGFREADTERAYALVEEHNRGLVNDPNDYYSIHTGRKIAMFTLYHYYRPEGYLPPQYNPYRYVRNLSTTLEEAVRKAIEIAGSHWLVLECDSTLKYDYSGEIFQFGKYKGERIEDVACRDMNYLLFLNRRGLDATNVSARVRENYRRVSEICERYWKEREERNRAESHSEWLGSVGDTVTDIQVTITFIKTVENDVFSEYDSAFTTVVKAVDSRENVVKMAFKSRTNGYFEVKDCNKGDTLHILRAKVKRCVESVGVKITELNFVKLEQNDRNREES